MNKNRKGKLDEERMKVIKLQKEEEAKEEFENSGYYGPK